MKNYYPEKPIVPPKKTSIEMPEIVVALKEIPAIKEVKISAYIMFRNESANGRSGINNNYIGAQADGGRWPEKFDNVITGIVQKNENRTGKTRLFLAFSSYKDSLNFLIDRVESRGLFVGGFAHKISKIKIETDLDLAMAYYQEWVTGDADYEPTAQELKDFLSMYAQGEKIFV